MKPLAAATAFLALLLSLTALGIAADNTPPSLMSRGDYAVAMRWIQDDARLALARCRKIAGDSERGICRAQARVNERVRAAALDARYRGTVAEQERARRVEVRAGSQLDRARRLAST
jgi:hypothetical protein